MNCQSYLHACIIQLEKIKHFPKAGRHKDASFFLISLLISELVQVPLEKQLLVDLNHMREVGPGDDTKYRGIEAKPDEGQGKAWAKVWDGPQHVVFGHDHKKGLQVLAFLIQLSLYCRCCLY